LYVIQNREHLEPGVYDVPEAIDERIAWLRLQALKIKLDELTPEQESYLESWEV
jgi:adenosylhomocysteinase